MASGTLTGNGSRRERFTLGAGAEPAYEASRNGQPALNTVIHEDEHLQVVHRPGTSPYTLVTFADLTARPRPGWFWGAAPAARLDLDAIGIMAHRPHWYPPAIIDRCADIVRERSKPLRLGYGYSMGGYAVLKHGRRLGLARALAVAPQATIDPAETGAEGTYAARFQPALHTGMRVTAAELAEWTAVLADPYDPEDGVQSSLLPDDPRLRRVAAPFLGHWAIWLLAETEAFARAMRHLHDADAAGLHRLVRSRRAGSLVWHRCLGGTALQRGHERLGTALLAEAARRGVPPAELGEVEGMARLRRANRLRAAGRAAEADRQAETAMAVLPPDAAALDRAGQTVLRADPARAAALFHAALAINPGHVDARFGLSHALMRRGDASAALAEALQVAAARPDDPELLAWPGHILVTLKAGRAAAPWLRAALIGAPTAAHAHLGLSHALGTQRRVREAVAAARQAVAHLPDHAELRDRLRELEGLQRRWLRRALRRRPVPVPDVPVQPDRLIALLPLAARARNDGRAKDAAALVASIAAALPADRDLLRHAGRTLHATDPDGAAILRRWARRAAILAITPGTFR